MPSPSRGDCTEFVRRTGKVDGKRLRVIPPNT